MRRISEKDLAQAVRTLNTEMGLPLEPYTKRTDGTYYENYLLDIANGGFALSQKSATGGERRILDRTTKRELHGQICALVQGIELGVRSMKGES